MPSSNVKTDVPALEMSKAIGPTARNVRRGKPCCPNSMQHGIKCPRYKSGSRNNESDIVCYNEANKLAAPQKNLGGDQ